MTTCGVFRINASNYTKNSYLKEFSHKYKFMIKIFKGALERMDWVFNIL